MRAKFLLATLFLLAGHAFGQFVQITGTAQDNIGLPYANGSIVTVLNVSGSPTINGQPYTPPQQPFGLDINGKFAFNLAANNQISPSGSTWSFIICSGTGTVSIAWGRQSSCFQVNNLTLNSAQDITAQISTSAQPLTYSASFLAAASPTCPLLDGIVDLDFSNQDLAHRASVQASALGSQVAVGVAVYVPGSQCLGVTQVATGLVVPIFTDNQSTIGDFVTSSTITRGQVHDYGNTVSATTRTYGQVIQANTGSGTISMVLYTGGGSGGGGGGGGSVGNCPVNGAIGWYQVAGTVIGCNVNLTADSLGNLTALGYFLNGTGTLEIQSTTYSGGLPSVCASLGTCLSFDTNGILNGSINGGAWFPYLNAFTGVLWDQIIDRDTTGVTDFSRFFDLLSNVNCAQPFVCVGGGAANSGVVNSSTMTDDLTNPVTSLDGLDVRTQGYYGVEIPVNVSTGVGQFLTGCDDGSGNVLVCNHSTYTTNVPAGIVEACNNAATPPTKISCATSGNAVVSIYGFLTVKFDNTATALHYAQQSSSVDGELSDVGASVPTNGHPYYFIWIGNAGAGTAGVVRVLTGNELLAAGGGNNQVIQVNGTPISTESPANFENGTGITITNPSAGNIQITASVSAPQALNPTAPTLANQNASGARSITYGVQACGDGPTCAYHSTLVTTNISNANASPQVLLSAYGDTLAHYRCFNIYVTADSGSRTGVPGLIANCVGKKYIDTGANGNSVAATNTNTTALDANGNQDPINPCNKLPSAPWLIDGLPCTPNALDDEFTETDAGGSPGDANNPVWTRANFGTSTLTLTNGELLFAPQSSSGDNWRLITQATPATPWSFVGVANMNQTTTSSVGQACGFVVYDGTKLETFIFNFQSSAPNWEIALLRYTNVTTFSANQAASVSNGSNFNGNWLYFKIQNDGTNLNYFYSYDGINYGTAFYTEAKGAFLTNTNNIGIGCNVSTTGPTPVMATDYFRRVQ